MHHQCASLPRAVSSLHTGDQLVTSLEEGLAPLSFIFIAPANDNPPPEALPTTGTRICPHLRWVDTYTPPQNSIARLVCGALLDRQIRRPFERKVTKTLPCVPVAAAIQGTSPMGRLVVNIVAGLGLAALADAVLFLSRRATYRVSHKPLAGPRPGSWLPG